jgi:peptide chain release factor 1
MLRAQLWEIEQEKRQAVVAGERAKIGRSMRAEKIRTYNFPQDRVTDHRIRQNWHGLPKIMAGNFAPIAEALQNFTGEFGDADEE